MNLNIEIFSVDNHALLELYKEHCLKIADSNRYLRDNYKLENLEIDKQEVFTIGFKNNEPFLFSSIYRRSYWPVGCYRILNRLWKVDSDSAVNTNIDKLYTIMIAHQLTWLKENKKDFKTAIITRNRNSKHTLELLSKHVNEIGLDFNVYNKKIRVCKGDDYNCLQDVLFYGNKELLDSWKI